MKGLYLLLISLLLVVKGFGAENDSIVYTSDRKLTWDDFKGKPNFFDRSKGAQITVTIHLKVRKVSFWSGKVTYDAVAIAYKNESWVKSEYRDAYTLAHEQLHFDIAHLYAETLEMEINRLELEEGQQEQVENLLRKYNKEMNAYQALYDKETRGGNSTAKQREWEKRIREDLHILNNART